MTIKNMELSIKPRPTLAIIGVISALTLRAEPVYVCSGQEPPEIGPHDIESHSEIAAVRYNSQDDETNNRAGQTFQMGTRLQNHLITGVTFYGYGFWGQPRHVTINIREQGREGALIASQKFAMPELLDIGYLTFTFDTRPDEGFTWASPEMEGKYKDEASGLAVFPAGAVVAVDTGSEGGGWRLMLYEANLIAGQFYKNDWDGWGNWDRRCVLHISAPPVPK